MDTEIIRLNDDEFEVDFSYFKGDVYTGVRPSYEIVAVRKNGQPVDLEYVLEGILIDALEEIRLDRKGPDYFDYAPELPEEDWRHNR